ncbi:MAG: hypothetical protein QOH16_1465 [Gaiellaceae bacterium]|nr:hypothetical protein [Gaiellaceae bacterium]
MQLLQKRIHDWSKTMEPWQSDLVRRLAAGPLADAGRAEVRAILLGDVGALPPVRLELADLPVDEDEHGRVELRSIGDFRNINCLAENQSLHLEPGLNLVFGMNGSGKTGHGRLLRGVCRAAEREQVLPNVFEPAKAAQPQTATIAIAVDGKNRPVKVDLAQQPDRVLSAVSVFDASCARIFVSKANVIDYVPRSLVILKNLAEEQDTIAAGLRADAMNLRGGLPSLPPLADGTAAAAALASVNQNTDLAALEQLGELTDAETNELEQLETAAATIRADTSGELETAARARASGATAAATAIRDQAARVDASTLDRFAELRRKADDIATAERELVENAFADSPFPAAGGEPWREMWSALVQYVESGGGTFPSDEPGAVCPACEQELTPEARTRLADAQQFVRSELRQRAEALDLEMQTLLAGIPDSEALKVRATSELRGAPEDIIAAAEAAVSTIAELGRLARAIAAGGHRAGDSPPALDVSAIEAYADAQAESAAAQAALRDAARQQEVLKKLGELQARRTLRQHLPSLKQRIDTLKRIALLDSSAGKLGTQAISLKLRDLQEAEITERLRAAIREELEYTTVRDKIELSGQASKGETKIQLKLAKGCKEKVENVLSAGEQSALGMAFFLAELSVSGGESAIVLEDPVSSLDHDYRAYLAERLVQETQKRQVVIYTHDLTFLVDLQQAAEDAGIEIHGQTLHRAFGEAGVVRESLPTEAMSPRDRRRDLGKRLRFELTPMFKKEDPEYAAAAKQWVGDLRDGYEQIVECYVVANTMRRFRTQIRMKQLSKMRWSPDLASRIYKGWQRASPKKHFEATERYPRPHEPHELEQMLGEFEAICNEIAPKEKGEPAKAPGEQTTLEDELVGQVASFPAAS